MGHDPERLAFDPFSRRFRLIPRTTRTTRKRGPHEHSSQQFLPVSGPEPSPRTLRLYAPVQDVIWIAGRPHVTESWSSRASRRCCVSHQRLEALSGFVSRGCFLHRPIVKYEIAFRVRHRDPPTSPFAIFPAGFAGAEVADARHSTTWRYVRRDVLRHRDFSGKIEMSRTRLGTLFDLPLAEPGGTTLPMPRFSDNRIREMCSRYRRAVTRSLVIPILSPLYLPSARLHRGIRGLSARLFSRKEETAYLCKCDAGASLYSRRESCSSGIISPWSASVKSERKVTFLRLGVLCETRNVQILWGVLLFRSFVGSNYCEMIKFTLQSKAFSLLSP